MRPSSFVMTTQQAQRFVGHVALITAFVVVVSVGLWAAL